jgi:pimeloyl-ACP methyl ester carboxylesterase
VCSSLAITAPTEYVDISGTRFTYRRFGSPGGTPLLFIQHFMGNLDNFDPAISDALAVAREIILFDNVGVGVGVSTGTAPDTVPATTADATRFIDAPSVSRPSISSATRWAAKSLR